MRTSALVLGTTLLAGCTTFQISGSTSTNEALVYTAIVDGDTKASFPVSKTTPLTATKIGNYREGSKVEVDVSLAKGGRISSQFQDLPGSPDPFTLSVQTNSIQGTYIDLGSASDIEKAITDVSGSFVSPTNDVTDLIAANMGGVYFVKDNPADAANPTAILLYGPSDLNSAAPASFYTTGPLTPTYSSQLLLDESSAAKVKSEIPSMAAVAADYAASDIYKYQLTLNNTGWRTSPVTWNAVRSALASSAPGQQILSDIQNKIANLHNGEHIYFMTRAYVVGDFSVTTYQAKRLDASADIAADNYFTLDAAYSMSNSVYDSKSAKNQVLRVNYDDLSLMNVTPQAHANNAFAAWSSDHSQRGRGITAQHIIIATPAMRIGNRFPNGLH